LTNTFRGYVQEGHPKSIFPPIRRKSPHLLMAVKIFVAVKEVEGMVRSVHAAKSRADWGARVIQRLNGLSERLAAFHKDLSGSVFENADTQTHRMAMYAFLQSRFNRAYGRFRRLHQETSVQELLLLSYSKRPKGRAVTSSLPLHLDSSDGLHPLPLPPLHHPVAFTEEDRQHLQAESLLYDQMDVTFVTSNQETQKIERQLRELFDLHDQMAEQIGEQAAAIGNIHEMAAESRVDVKEGNSELADAMQSTWSQRTLQTCLILTLAAILLVFHIAAN
jgi:hypothetical protein